MGQQRAKRRAGCRRRHHRPGRAFRRTDGADAAGLADAINAGSETLRTRLRTADDVIITAREGVRPLRTCETRFAAPGGRDDCSPDLVELTGGPGSGPLCDTVVVFALKMTTGYAAGTALAERLEAAGERLEILPRRPR